LTLVPALSISTIGDPDYSWSRTTVHVGYRLWYWSDVRRAVKDVRVIAADRRTALWNSSGRVSVTALSEQRHLQWYVQRVRLQLSSGIQRFVFTHASQQGHDGLNGQKILLKFLQILGLK